MAISRMNMERQMRNMGGIMGLEDQRQGYFLGKLVKKITKPIKKIVKSPLGKTALLAAAGFGIPGTSFGGLFGRAAFGGQATGLLGSKGIGALLGSGGKFSTLGDIFRVGGKAGADFSVPRILAGLGTGAAIAAPFLMGGDEEEVDEGTPFTMAQPDIEDIRSQARRYYSDPTNSALYFMPPKSAVRSSFFAGGGLADIPREGYKEGGLMDLGGMEKDYREGGFVPIGAKERADDVPARLSKNEFVFTADAVRNAGGGDIDKGAEVMQNMMDNLEAGGSISEESQGMENPAQAMFDQAQMLEGRLA